MFKLALAFGGGIAVGLWLAKQYASVKVSDSVHDALDKAGLAGGQVESIVQSVVKGVVLD